MGILLGLVAALGWGTADLIARGSTRRIGSQRTMFYAQFFGALVLSAYLLVSGEFARIVPTVPSHMWLLALVTALVGIASSFSLYRSFEVGVISIVSPIAACYAAVTVVLSLFSGETLTAARAAGVIASLFGVVLVSVSSRQIARDEAAARRWNTPPGLWSAVCAAIGYGFLFWLIGTYLTPVFGGVMPVWISRMVTILLFLIGILVLRLRLPPPGRNAVLPVIGISVLDTIAYTSTTLGVLTEQVSIVTVLSSLFSAVTVILAWLFLRERLERNQLFGIALIFAGIVLVSI